MHFMPLARKIPPPGGRVLSNHFDQSGILLAMDSRAFRIEFEPRFPQLRTEGTDETGNFGAIGGGWCRDLGGRPVGPAARGGGAASLYADCQFPTRPAAYNQRLWLRRRTYRRADPDGRQ